MSAATARLFKEMGSWIIALAMVAASIVYFDDIRALTRLALGTHGADQFAEMQPERSAQSAQTNSYGGSVELLADRRGHYLTTAYINGNAVDVMVDTGASMVALSYEDAQNAGIHVSDSDYTGRSQTANGVARIAFVKINDISIGGITIRNVVGAVAEPGRLSQTLLGMSFLSRLSRFEVRSGVLIMED